MESSVNKESKIDKTRWLRWDEQKKEWVTVPMILAGSQGRTQQSCPSTIMGSGEAVDRELKHVLKPSNHGDASPVNTWTSYALTGGNGFQLLHEDAADFLQGNPPSAREELCSPSRLILFVVNSF